MIVPVSMADIDAAFLSDVLQTVVHAVTVERIAIGEGFLGELARIHVASDDPLVPATVIAKIPTTDSGLKPLGVMLGFYDRESRFYREIAPEMMINLPACFYNGSNGEDFALILEDVGHLVRGDHLAGATLDQAYAAVDAAAGVHSHWWKNPDLDKFDWVPRIDNPINMSLQSLYESSWSTVVDRYGHHFDDELIRSVEEFLPTCCDMLTYFGDLSVTLVHNDYRLDNMFFGGDDGTEMTLIDWQIVGKGDGGGDLVPFLMCNLETDLRRVHEDALLRRYHETMNAAGAGYATFEDLHAGLGRSMMFWLTAWGNTAVTALSTNDRAEALFDSVMQRVTAAARDHQAWQYTGDFGWKPTYL